MKSCKNECGKPAASGKKFCSTRCARSYGGKQHRKLRTRISVEGVIEQSCTECNDWKTQDQFYKDKQSPNGYSRICKECHAKKYADTRNSSGGTRRSCYFIVKDKLTKKNKLIRTTSGAPDNSKHWHIGDPFPDVITCCLTYQ